MIIEIDDEELNNMLKVYVTRRIRMYHRHTLDKILPEILAVEKEKFLQEAKQQGEIA